MQDNFQTGCAIKEILYLIAYCLFLYIFYSPFLLFHHISYFLGFPSAAQSKNIFEMIRTLRHGSIFTLTIGISAAGIYPIWRAEI